MLRASSCVVVAECYRGWCNPCKVCTVQEQNLNIKCGCHCYQVLPALHPHNPSFFYHLLGWWIITAMFVLEN